MIVRPPSATTALLLLAAVLLGACRPSSTGAPQASTDARESVTALARIVPGRAVIQVGAPVGERLATLHATEGQRVAKGDILATLASHGPREAELAAARVALNETRRRLAAETALAEADITRADAALALARVRRDHARRELERVRKTGDASTAREADMQAFLAVESERGAALAEAALEVARRTREQTIAAVGLDSAVARVATLEAQLELSLVRAPLDGTVLKVFAYPGELTGSGPVLQLGATDDMQAIAEVQAEDVALVRVGQAATLTGAALGSDPVRGIVAEVGALIYKNDVLDLDPRAPRDTRVVEVRIRIADPARIAGLTNLEVDARIHLR